MKGLFSNLCWTLKTEYQHIRYIPSVVRYGQATWANIFYISSGLRHWKANSMTAMTCRRDNDTSVKSKVERDRTVATKDGGRGRSSRWWNSNGAICKAVWCVPSWGLLRTNTNNRRAFSYSELPCKTIDIKKQAAVMLCIAVACRNKIYLQNWRDLYVRFYCRLIPRRVYRRLRYVPVQCSGKSWWADER